MTRFTASRPVLDVLAARAGTVVSGTSVQSATQNLRVQASADPQGLRLTGTDLELTVITGTPAVSVAEAGEVLIPARKFLEALREAPGSDVTVATSEDAQKRPVVRISSGGMHWDLRLPNVTFPAIPEMPEDGWTTVDRAALAGAIKTVRHAASRDGSYPAYACVTIVPDDVADADGVFRTMVMASDMARFQFAEIPQRVIEGAACPGFPFACSIPSSGTPRAVDEVLRLLDATDLPQAEIAQTEGALGFKVGSSLIMVTKLHARPADTKRALARAAMANTQQLTLSRDALKAAVRRVRITADPSTPVIGIRLSPGQAVVLSQDKFGNRSEQTVEAKWEEAGERLMLVNAALLTDMLGVHGSDQCLFLIAPETKDRRKSVIMLADQSNGTTGLIPQMANEAARLGYE